MCDALTFQNISVGYAGKIILSDVSATIPKGKFTALIGPNGCGKSTLLKTIIRSLPIQAGRILLGQDDMAHIAPRELARRVSMLPQTLHAPDGVSVRQLAGYGRSPYIGLWGRLATDDRSVVDEALERMNISSLAKTQVSELSGGQQQRAWLAMILAQRTPLVLLDEPTTFLDISHQIEVLNLCQDLAREGRTVVAVLHDLNQAFRYADHVIVLSQGRVSRHGEPSAVATTSCLAETFSIDARIVTDTESYRPMMVVKQRQPSNAS